MAAAQRVLEGQDEAGRSWMVYEGDMAWPLCYQLSRIGVKEIVLPSGVYRAGKVPSEVPDYVGGFTVQDVQASEDVKLMVRRWIRLQDCCAWLQTNFKEATPALV